MTAATTPRRSAAGTDGVGAAGVLRSEWLKLVTVRSTWWTTATALVLALGAALLLGAALRPEAGTDAGDLAANGATVGLSFVALVVGVLGALAIGGEYATLQIRSSYTAVPRRWPALVAKAVVVGAWSFVLGLVVTAGGFGVIAGLFGARGATVSLTGPAVGTLLGGAVYLAVVAVFAVGLGAVVRASAAGITILAALLFVAPVIVGLIAGLTRAAWAETVSDYLLSNVGAVLFAPPGGASIELWAAWLALVCWLAAAWVPAIVLTQARDV